MKTEETTSRGSPGGNGCSGMALNLRSLIGVAFFASSFDVFFKAKPNKLVCYNSLCRTWSWMCKRMYDFQNSVSSAAWNDWAGFAKRNVT